VLSSNTDAATAEVAAPAAATTPTGDRFTTAGVAAAAVEVEAAAAAVAVAPATPTSAEQRQWEIEQLCKLWPCKL
jgi:hypothetical protein